MKGAEMKEGQEVKREDQTKQKESSEQESGKKRKITRKGCFVLFVLFFFCFILVILACAFLFMMSISYAPQIKGKVVDAETEQPIPSARLKTALALEPTFDVMVRINRVTYETGKDGSFKIPAYRRFKLFAPRLYEREILVYAHGYKALDLSKSVNFLGRSKKELLFNYEIEAKDEVKTGLLEEGTIIELSSLKTAEEWWKEIEHYNCGSESLEENKWDVEECELFVRKFPDSPFAPKALLNSAYIYYTQVTKAKVIGEEVTEVVDEENANLAIKQFQKVIEQYPNTAEADQARYSIQSIKKDLREKIIERR